MGNSEYTPDHPEYVSLKSVLKGGYFIGFIESFFVFLLILGVRAVLPILELPTLLLTWVQVAGLVMVSYFFFPAVLALVQRPLVVRAQHPIPGGLLYALCDILVPPLVYLVVALIVTLDAGKAAAVGTCALVFYLAYAVWTKPWTPGFTRAEIRSKIRETKLMTLEMFGEIMQEHAEIDDPAIKNLFLPGNRYRMSLDGHDQDHL